MMSYSLQTATRDSPSASGSCSMTAAEALATVVANEKNEPGVVMLKKKHGVMAMTAKPSIKLQAENILALPTFILIPARGPGLKITRFLNLSSAISFSTKALILVFLLVRFGRR
ncbi:hypothetical protein WICPIJ_000529 [Wickerhamomyces pijperi]|uniref:Uncharacterized protein n=1 Tax=Wickerhamomyces pijperi TaxID=599730 RepID=A0A9P8TSF9_WICPI|nr:hypothetical protein WICPIJ_000529 [Wickerhamomyces pijperi]